VLELLQIIYPEHEKTENPFGLTGIAGKYVPDGLIVNQQGNITGVLEYTLSGRSDKLVRQNHGFHHLVDSMQALIDKEEAEFMYVTPEQNRNNVPAKFNNVNFQPLPFNSADFRKYVDDTFSNDIHHHQNLREAALV
jgi:hypothetical protein